MPPSPAPPAVVESVRARLRAAMPITERWAYFDHAAVAPVSRPAAAAIEAWLHQATTEGDTVWPEWARACERARSSAARLVGGHADEVALVANTTTGINLVAEGIDWRQGDNVVVLDDEFPSNLYPWMQQAAKGVEVRRVPTSVGRVALDDLRAACDRRTRVVSASWVSYATGYRHDVDALGAIAHEAGALFFLDAIQGLGVFPLDVTRTPVDFLAADGHKWLLGPEGAGVAWFRRERLAGLRPLGVGWGSVVDAHNFGQVDLTLRPTAARYEGGSANMPGLHALGANLALLQESPTADLAAALLDVTDYLSERLHEAGAEVVSHRKPEPSGHDPRSGIVVATPARRSPEEARNRLREAGVVTSVRGGRLRMSPHAYTSYDEVDRLVAALR